MSTLNPNAGSGNSRVSLVLIAPDNGRRLTIAKIISGTQARVVNEFSVIPAGSALTRLAESNCDAIVVDLDAGVEQGIDLIEAICGLNSHVTVMACSTGNEGSVIIRAMRAGAREFLTEPLASATMADALVRAAARRQNAGPDRAKGKVLVFRGTKGGTGVTTLATNFAVAMTKELCGDVVIVDMHPQLGEVALSLGLSARFSLADALANAARLDADFLSTLLTRHESGLAVLASPEDHGTGSSRSVERGAERLFRVLQEEFAFVVVDAGSCSGNTPDPVFDIADTIYLVTEVNLPALRNARRMISYLESKNDCRLELVLNRHNSRIVEIDEESTVSALTRPPDWKVPNDYLAVRGAQNLGISLVEDRPVSRVIRQMAKAAAGKSAGAPEIKQASLKGEKWKFWTSNSMRQISTPRS
jgi:pilus assembly protein CpaE